MKIELAIYRAYNGLCKANRQKIYMAEAMAYADYTVDYGEFSADMGDADTCLFEHYKSVVAKAFNTTVAHVNRVVEDHAQEEHQIMMGEILA